MDAQYTTDSEPRIEKHTRRNTVKRKLSFLLCRLSFPFSLKQHTSVQCMVLLARGMVVTATESQTRPDYIAGRNAISSVSDGRDTASPDLDQICAIGRDTSFNNISPHIYQ